MVNDNSVDTGCSFVIGGKASGEIDLELWYDHYKKYWTEQERREYEDQVLNDWKIRHGRCVQVNLF